MAVAHLAICAESLVRQGLQPRGQLALPVIAFCWFSSSRAPSAPPARPEIDAGVELKMNFADEGRSFSNRTPMCRSKRALPPRSLWNRSGDVCSQTVP